MRKVVIAAVSVATMLGGFALAAPAASANEPHDEHCAPWDSGVTILGSRLADRIIGTDCDDVLLGFGGNDVIRGKFGTDLLRGGRGDDRISAAGEEGRINGGSGYDTCVVDVDSEVTVVRCEVIIEVDA